MLLKSHYEKLLWIQIRAVSSGAHADNAVTEYRQRIGYGGDQLHIGTTTYIEQFKDVLYVKEGE